MDSKTDRGTDSKTDLSVMREQSLTSNKSAVKKAEALLLRRMVNELSKDEWRELIAEVPEDVLTELGRLMSASTQGIAKT